MHVPEEAATALKLPNIREVSAYDTIIFGPLFQDVNNGGKNYGSLKVSSPKCNRVKHARTDRG